jgi:hypothetical protein
MSKTRVHENPLRPGSSAMILPVTTDQLPMYQRELSLIEKHQELVDQAHLEANKFWECSSEADKLEKRASELEDWDDEEEAEKRKES